MRVAFEEVLDFLWGCFDTFSRRDLGWVLAGYHLTDTEKRALSAMRRMQRDGLIAQTGRGVHARYVVTNAGQRRATVDDPTPAWDTPWDGRWRVVTYDLPEIRRKERYVLWQALRAKKLGLLQRSVWIWPHPAEPILMDVLRARGIPECFCGFEAERVFLCSNTEIVQTAWKWTEIDRQHQVYLKHLVANPTSLAKARQVQAIAQITRIERHAYQSAFALDPLLPRELCPPDYRGFAVEARHKAFRAELRRCARALRPSPNVDLKHNDR